ncbi:MAG: hypothetical protein RLZZ04_167 [Cyanobacteriota bacterium]|jgi:hypothetical protein
MNLKILTVTTLFLTLGATVPAWSANQDELLTFKNTRQCVDCNLSGTDISQQNLRNANVERANLYNTNLANSDLRDANFSDSNSQKANFDGSDLRNVNFSYANVSGANFCNADVRGVNWKSVTYDESTKCLPKEALEPASTVTTNNPAPANGSADSGNSITEDVQSVQRNVESVRSTTNTIRDIFRLF